SAHSRFIDFTRQMREVGLGAYAHQDLPFEYLVEALEPERSLSRNPLAQVTLTFQNTPRGELKIGKVIASPIEIDASTVEFDLSLFMDGDAQGLAGAFVYNTDLFDSSSIKRLTQHFQALLAAVVAAPQAPNGHLRIL